MSRYKITQASRDRARVLSNRQKLIQKGVDIYDKVGHVPSWKELRANGLSGSMVLVYYTSGTRYMNALRKHLQFVGKTQLPGRCVSCEILLSEVEHKGNLCEDCIYTQQTGKMQLVNLKEGCEIQAHDFRAEEDGPIPRLPPWRPNWY